MPGTQEVLPRSKETVNKWEHFLPVKGVAMDPHQDTLGSARLSLRPCLFLKEALLQVLCPGCRGGLPPEWTQDGEPSWPL